MRLDPLNNEWVVIAAHRQGRIFLPPKELNPLAPSRPGFLTEIPESDYEVVVFDNRSPSLRPPSGAFSAPAHPDFESLPIPAAGKCEVVCFTSNYDASFKDLSHKQIRTVLEAWRDRTAELSELPYIEHIAPFENHVFVKAWQIRSIQKAHTSLLWSPITFLLIARPTRDDQVHPAVLSTTAIWNNVLSLGLTLWDCISAICTKTRSRLNNLCRVMTGTTSNKLIFAVPLTAIMECNSIID